MISNLKESLHYTPIIAIVALLCAAALSSGCSKPEYSDISGESGRFVDFRGKWLVINYWAEWCEPCREEIPEFNRLSENNKDSIEVLAVSFDLLSVEELASQAKRMQIKYRVLTGDPAGLLGFRKPPVLPATYIMKPDGSFFKELLGPQTEQSIRALLIPQQAAN
ncbi:MAG: TlpA family protein disulfide reductase [Pseudomonadales bacterium]|nr:TlpA family protein disulfide reductase [Pseudomonadales bacterium]